MKQKYDAYETAFAVGTTLTFPAPTACSTSDVVAGKFMKGIQLVIHRAAGVALVPGQLSAYDESEVMLPFPSTFKVIARSKVQDTVVVMIEPIPSAFSYCSVPVVQTDRDSSPAPNSICRVFCDYAQNFFKGVYTKFYNVNNKNELNTFDAHVLIECLECIAAFLISACLILLIVLDLIIIVAGLTVHRNCGPFSYLHPAPQNMVANIMYCSFSIANIMYCSFSMLPCSFLAVASLLVFFDPYATAKKAKEDLEDTQMWMLAFFLFLVSHHYSSSTTTAAAWWVASAALATSVGRYAVGTHKKKGVGVVSMIGWLLSSAVLLGSSLVPLGLIVFIIRGTRPPPI
jgi:hypothetical protein